MITTYVSSGCASWSGTVDYDETGWYRHNPNEQHPGVWLPISRAELAAAIDSKWWVPAVPPELQLPEGF